MNFEALESFGCFAKSLNFTRAAELRHISQPALHKQIRNLSESLGVELYIREGRSLRLTEAGISLAKFSIEISDRIEHVTADIKEISPRSKVAVAAGRGSYLYLLGDALKEFALAYENKIRLLTTNQTETLSAIRCGQAHLGVTVLSELPTDMNTLLLHEMTPRLIVTKEHSLAGRKSISLKNLDGLPMICPSSPSPMREMLASRLNEEGLDLNVTLEANGWELLMHFASLGIGATIVNGCCRPPEGTVAIRIPALPKTRYYLVSHQEEYQFAELNYLRQCIIKHAKEFRFSAN